MKNDKKLIGEIELTMPGKPISDGEIVKTISHAARGKNMYFKNRKGRNTIKNCGMAKGEIRLQRKPFVEKNQILFI